MMDIFSSPEEIESIAKHLKNYMRLPASRDAVPGAILEAIIAHVRRATVRPTYEFVDVLHTGERLGWSIKSTKAATPLTWKRAKIANRADLIRDSQRSPGLQALGDAILDFCDAHPRKDLESYSLREIGYARLILFPGGRACYFERKLCDSDSPEMFRKGDFAWEWSKQKTTKTKEQMSALHGTHKQSGRKWWAWHGQGENQLHFNGEREWWPAPDSPHSATFTLPSDDERLSLDDLNDLLDRL